MVQDWGRDMLGPTLTGARVTLQAAQPEDLPIFRRWFADMQVSRYLLMRFPPSEQQEAEWYSRTAESQNSVHWSVKLNGVTIGSTGIDQIDPVHRHAVTGMVIGERSEWRKGYATEAVQLRTRYAFEELGLETLYSQSVTGNIGMHRALEHSGYKQVGRLRRHTYGGGEWHDVYIFEVLRQEWVAPQ